jgi:hypothetical protein
MKACVAPIGFARRSNCINQGLRFNPPSELEAKALRYILVIHDSQSAISHRTSAISHQPLHATRVLSIITVVKSPVEGFEKTYASVLQEFGNLNGVEYLIKEWNAVEEWSETSGDDSNAPRLNIRKIRGKDSGVFDGMNQSVTAAQGEWILFLNAGDWLAKGFGDLLHEAIQSATECDYIYCDGVTVDADDGREFLRKAPESLRLPHFLHCAPVLHPCLIVKKSYLEQHLFNLDYDLAADYALMVELVASGAKGRHLPVVAAFILSGGLSERARIRGKRQALTSLLRNAPDLGFKIRSVLAFCRFMCRHILIVYGVRSFGPLRRWAKSRTGGQPAGTYS